MSTAQHVELEAAKLLQKLIQESTDEPAKLATKLYVICQHMKASGKEHSLPYQVISRAMEKVINQHGLDINVLRSRIPLSSGPLRSDTGHGTLMGQGTPDNQLSSSQIVLPQSGISTGTWHGTSSSQTKEAAYTGPFQNFGMQQASKAVPEGEDVTRHELIFPSKPLVGFGRVDSVPVDTHQGSLSHRSGKSSEQESPASVPMDDTRSANSPGKNDSLKLDNKTNKKAPKKAGNKRKRADSKTASDAHSENPQQSDNISTGSNSRKGAAFIRDKQEGNHPFSKRIMDEVKSSNPFLISPKHNEDGEVSSGQSSGVQKGKMLTRSNIPTSAPAWSHNRLLQSQVSQGINPEVLEPSSDLNIVSSYHANEPKGVALGPNDSPKHSSLPSSLAHGSGKTLGTASAFSSFAMTKPGFTFPAHQSSYPFESQYTPSKLQNDKYLGSYSGSQLLEKGGDENSININAVSPTPGSAKPASDGTHHVTQRFLEASTSSSLHTSDASAGFDTSGKAVLQEKRGGHHIGASPYTNPMVRGVQDRHSLENVTSERNQDAFSKLKSGPNMYAEPCGNVLTIAPRNAISNSSNTPFNGQQLRQLRAQCLVFLAFRNSLVPRKLHLEIALGANYTQDGGSADGGLRVLNDCAGNEKSACDSVDNHERSGMFDRENDTINGPTAASSCGTILERDSSSRAMECVKKNKINLDTPMMSEENKHVSVFKQGIDTETKAPEKAESYIASSMPQFDSLEHSGRNIHDRNLWMVGTGLPNRQELNAIHVSSAVCLDNPPLIGVSDMLRTKNNSEFFKESSSIPMVHQDYASEEIENCSGHSQIMNDSDNLSRSNRPVSPMSEATKASDRHLSLAARELAAQSIGKNSDNLKFACNSLKDANMFFNRGVLDSRIRTTSDFSLSNHSDDAVDISDGMDDVRASAIQKLDIQGQSGSNGIKIITSYDLKCSNPDLLEYDEEEEEYESPSSGMPFPPRVSTSDKWIMDYQKIKLAEEQKWTLKQKTADEMITSCYAKLKENVSSSEDISAKTKSVIELKKLQLLKLQRRLRSEFLNDFFKPISSDMERLSSIKKHRHGRRAKQLEKFEQKMKEERLKRIRERQKEFFTEIEAHREKLEDYFKVKRERWKGFNRYAKEFHKRKERIFREKFDRIQREKINLLKNNDVEGYLRMVQDAKSDRVRQLLKETEKYLQKLGSKLKDAKGMSRRFEMEIEDSRPTDTDEKDIIAFDNEDESDQAQHYLESNEKYYMLAHSIKESINEQPCSLIGGKLREYQMNGLRWLVSLYNNHLNGILADEMGLGKTVQVIALICYLMEKKNDRGPFLVVVPSSVLPGWASEIKLWAPSINAIAYAGLPEDRRKLFKERIIHRKFNVLLTTYEYLMNKHDKPKLSKVQWHYIIIDEGHRIKNASCKLNADLKHYSSTHRLLLTGTPLQNNLDELWALLNFLLPSIFNSSEDFSQWFNKPFESNVDAALDEALLTEEENLLIINRLHQVLRPFVLRRLKHKVENELPEKIERLVRCEASAYQKLLMKRVEDNLGSLGNVKQGRSVHNTVMEMRNICNHPYLSQLHAEEIDSLLPKHYLPPVIRLCGKLEMLDRLLPKLKATDHRVLFFSTMTRLLDVMEEYLCWKRYKYLRLDGHTSGNDRGALIDEFNHPDSETFIFLLSIRAGGVGVNLQAADTVIIFDTDWNPQVDLQAQARAHRIGQKKEVLILRFETVGTVEEHVRASAEHKLGVANQSITAGFFDNHTSAEDRREYLESLLRECKKEEAALVLDDDSLNDLLARSESEIDVFESIDKIRREEEMAAWFNLVQGNKLDALKPPLLMPSRLVIEDDLKPFYEVMRIYDTSTVNNAQAIAKRKGKYLGGLDTEHYGRGKRAREVRSYEDQWTEEEFEKMCQVDSPESTTFTEPPQGLFMPNTPCPSKLVDAILTSQPPTDPLVQPIDSLQPRKDPCIKQESPVKRGRGRPKRTSVHITSPESVQPASFAAVKRETGPHKGPFAASVSTNVTANSTPQFGTAAFPFFQSPSTSSLHQGRGRGRGRKQKSILSNAVGAQLNAYTLIQKGIDVTGFPNFPSTGYHVSQMQGSSSSTETHAEASSSHLLGNPNSSLSVSAFLKNELPITTTEEKELGAELSVCEAEPAYIGAKLPVTTDEVSILQPIKSDNVKTDTHHTPVEQISGLSIPDALSPKESQAENEADILREKTKKTAHDIDILSIEKPVNDVNSIQILDKAAPKLHVKPSEMLKTEDENKNDISGQLNQEKKASIYTLLERNSASTSGYTSLATNSSSDCDRAKVAEPEGLVPKTTKTENSVTLATGQLQCFPDIEYNRATPTVIPRESENRASVTRIKAAARETRNRSNTTTAACERRARQAGLKQADSSKKLGGRGRTAKASSLRAKEESQIVLGHDAPSVQRETLLGKLDALKHTNQQTLSSEKVTSSAAMNFELNVSKELKVDEDVTCTSSMELNNTMSTITSSSNDVESGLVLGLPSLREFPLTKIDSLESKENKDYSVNASIQLANERDDNLRNAGMNRLLEGETTTSVKRAEGFSEPDVKLLSSGNETQASNKNSVPEVFEVKTGDKLPVKSIAKNSKICSADLNQNQTGEICSVPFVPEVIHMTVKEPKQSDHEKDVQDENKSKNLVFLENENDRSISSADLPKVTPLQSVHDNVVAQDAQIYQNIPDKSESLEAKTYESVKNLPAVVTPDRTHEPELNPEYSVTRPLSGVCESIEHDILAPSVIPKAEGSKNRLNLENKLKNLDGVVLALPTESEPPLIHHETPAEIKPVRSSTSPGIKSWDSGDKKIIEAGRAEEKSTESLTDVADKSGIEEHSVNNVEENVKISSCSEDLQTHKADDASNLLKSLSDVGISSVIGQQDSAIGNDGLSHSFPSRDTEQDSKVFAEPENFDSTEIKP